MKKVLVTGGSGFIGSNLIRSLLGPEHEIYLLVQPNDTLWRIKDIADKLIIFYIGLTEFSTINTVISVIKPDIIFHLASFGGMPYETDSKAIFDVNFYGTLNLLNACKKVGFECFINTGSSSEYGKKNIPMHEDLVLEPISDYAVSKAASTQLCLKEALFNKLPIYTVRPFSVYGDAELHTRLIPTIALSIVCNEPLQLSSPYLVRDFIYIDDMIALLQAVADKKPTNHFIFNAGSGVQSSIQDAVNAAQLLRAFPGEVQWGKHTPRPWEPTHWVADITRSQTVLEWTPRFTLTTGLEKTIIWFKNNLHLYGERLGAYVPASSTSKQPETI
ncbi:NAD(P)-dependent oxidoreductase [Candidatus Dependentiae bacterium]|nr:NAD(P)-dependent oxidoreductase [Candidatus Dependentiae bacterium]